VFGGSLAVQAASGRKSLIAPRIAAQRGLGNRFIVLRTILLD